MAKGNRKELFQKIADATVSGGGNNLKDGRGRLAVKSIKMETGFKGERFVAEFIVVSSSKISVVEAKTGKSIDVDPNPVGSEVSWVQMLDQHDSALGNVKGFVLELFGEQDTTREELIATLEKICQECDDPKDNVDCAGMVIDYETYRKVTQKNKVEIVLPKWSHVEQSADDIKEMRAWLENLFSGGGNGSKTESQAQA